jgi:FixJ family two-component response regulator
MPEEPYSIWIVDDDDSIRRALRRLLSAAGYDTRAFESAEDFLESSSCLSEGCLVLDIRLPGMSGLDLQEKLASRGVKLPVIFITAHDNPQWQEKAKKAGAVAYLKKPFSERSLLDAIQVACSKAS